MERQRKRTARLVTTTISILVVLLFGGNASAHLLSETTKTINGYKFAFREFNWQGKDGVALQIWKGKHKLWEQHQHNQWIFSLDTQEESFPTKQNTKIKVADLNGDGIVDVIVQQWNGGAHCCYTYDIFSLGPNLKRIWHHYARDGHLHVHLHKNALPELAVEDCTFAYWNGGFSDSPKPVIFLRWRNHAFQIVNSRLLKPVDLTKLSRLANTPLTPAANKYFVELIYAGHAREAMMLMAKVNAEDKLEFLQSFYRIFKDSPFHDNIAAINDKSAMAQIEQASAK